MRLNNLQIDTSDNFTVGVPARFCEFQRPVDGASTKASKTESTRFPSNQASCEISTASASSSSLTSAFPMRVGSAGACSLNAVLNEPGAWPTAPQRTWAYEAHWGLQQASHSEQFAVFWRELMNPRRSSIARVVAPLTFVQV